MKALDKSLKDLNYFSKGEHSLKDVLERATEVYDARTRYNKADDGLRDHSPKDMEEYETQGELDGSEL